MTTTTVTMPLHELDEIRKSQAEMVGTITKLRQDLIDAKLSDPAVAELAKLCRNSLEIVSFAIANLSPEIIKRWPYESLRKMSEAIKTFPDYSPSDQELAFEMLKFANECEYWERKRKSEPERYVPPPAHFIDPTKSSKNVLIANTPSLADLIDKPTEAQLSAKHEGPNGYEDLDNPIRTESIISHEVD